MTTTKPTPGPWIAQKTDITVKIGDYALRVADTRVCLSIMTDECEANARLIASAPELLDLARLVIKTHGNTNTMFHDLVVAANAVVAKAEGKQPCTI